MRQDRFFDLPRKRHQRIFVAPTWKHHYIFLNLSGENMPPKKFDVIWEAPPHTLAKIAILKGYLLAWFQIMGRAKRKQKVLYVDGFAGPGEYTNSSQSSPIAALTAAKAALSLSGNSWIAGDIHCAFIETDAERLNNLRARIEPFDNTPGLHIHSLGKSFVDGLHELKSQIPSPFTHSHPLFVFIDPFGATGAPFSVVTDILRSRGSEVLINLDADGIARIFLAKANPNRDSQLTEIFGDASWQGILSENLPFQTLCYRVLDLYKAKLRKLPQVEYVFAFEMRSTRGAAETLSYFLVFASQHHLGLEKMKEAMRRIDTDGDYRFSDAKINQPSLFRFDDLTPYSTELYCRFRGRVVHYSEIRKFALNETPFTNPKGMLKLLEDKELIAVNSSDPKRRKGTFNEDKILSVKFAEKEIQ